MNTAQLTILWYGGLVVVGILVFRAMGAGSASYLVAAIVVPTRLGIYSLSPHVKARKRWVAAWVLGPTLAVGAGSYGWLEFTEQRDLRLIRTDQVTVDNIEIVDDDRLSARVTNQNIV